MKFFISFTFFVWFFCSAKLFAVTPVEEGGLIRDAEIEVVLKSYLTPLFKAAELNPDSLKLYVIHSNEVNAFAMGGGRIALNTGLILKANSALQVMGVLAHETAHLAGNHVIRGMDAYEKALLKGLLGIIGGIAVGVAGNPEAGMGLLMGAQELAKQQLLGFSRAQESAADQGAARYLDRLGYSSKGLLEFMEVLKKNDFFRDQYADPYAQTHPLKEDRLEFFQAHLNSSAHADSLLPPEFEKNFQRIRVKIAAFTEKPDLILGKFKSDDSSLLSHYGRAIALFQKGNVEDSLKEMEVLLKEAPEDAFFWELKGQILFDSGKFLASIKAYEKAIKLRPELPLFRVNLAHAMIESGKAEFLEKAHGELLRAKTEEPDNPFTYRLLAVYYGKKGDVGLAALSLAEMYMEVGDIHTAEQQIKRSLHFLKEDASSSKARAQHILDEIKRYKGEKI